jgi:hypothetical protein
MKRFWIFIAVRILARDSPKKPVSMSRSLLLLVCCLALLSGSLSAQSGPRILCGNDMLMDMWRTHHPDFVSAIDETYLEALQTQAQVRGPLTVNVVVHVVWKNEAENLSDELIHEQIAILNEDFNRQNADTANLRALFQPVAGSADIHFQLAAIERVQTTEDFTVSLLGNDILPKLKYTAQGGSNAWDTEKYLNIWVCRIRPLTLFGIELGQILGFAFPPAGLTNWPAGSNAPTPADDGVVVDFRVWGRSNPNPIKVPGSDEDLEVVGRTPTHEVGHYLGLRHIWGDGGLFGPNDCMQSDGIEDTPFASSQSDFDCDPTRNTCQVIDPFYGMDMPDLIENYMDYSAETCMNMFTKGQVTHMRNVLMGPRSGLLAGSTSTRIEAETPGWHLFPNPAATETFLRWVQAPESPVQLRLYNSEGRVVFSQVLPAGQHLFALDTASLPRGFYVVSCLDANGITHQKLIVGR